MTSTGLALHTSPTNRIIAVADLFRGDVLDPKRPGWRLTVTGPNGTPPPRGRS